MTVSVGKNYMLGKPSMVLIVALLSQYCAELCCHRHCALCILNRCGTHMGGIPRARRSLGSNTVDCCALEWMTETVVAAMASQQRMWRNGFPSCAEPSALEGQRVDEVQDLDEGEGRGGICVGLRVRVLVVLDDDVS